MSVCVWRVCTLVAFSQFSRTSLIQQEWKSLLQRVHRRQKEMERKPHGGVGCSGEEGGWWWWWGGWQQALGLLYFPSQKNHSIKSNSNNDDKVMLWISSAVNLQQRRRRPQREFSSVFTTTNQNYVALHSVWQLWRNNVIPASICPHVKSHKISNANKTEWESKEETR